MAIKIGKNKYKCMYCNKIFPEEIKCDMHRDKEHSIVYVPFLAEDLERLRKFLYFKDDRLLTESLSIVINKFARQSAKKQLLKQEMEELENTDKNE